MSFEGYYQILCDEGHHYCCDVHDFNMSWTCPICSKKVAWTNLVDTTNGSWDENDKRIDGYIELDVIQPALTCTCPTCNNVHIVEPCKYKIPTDKVRK